MRRWRRNDRDQDLERELRADLELEAAEQREKGLSAEEARYAAQRALGNTTCIKEEAREMWGWISFERLKQDVAYALVILRRSPGLAITALLSLALGIGANTAVFTVLYTVLLKPLPVPNPEQLVVLASRGPVNSKEPTTRFSYPMLEALSNDNQVLSGPFTYLSDVLSLSNGGETPERLRGLLVSGNYFPVLGVSPERGRTFSQEDDQKGNPHAVAVISHGFWTQRFGGDPELIGRTLRLNGYPVTIIGIMGPDFYGTQVGVAPDLWAPIRLMDRLRGPGMMLDNTNATWLPAMARLNPGIQREQAQAVADTLYRRIRAGKRGKRPDDPEHLLLLPGSQGLSKLQEQFARPLEALIVLAGLVLLIGCANIANLLLARSTARQKEIAVRLAIGASRGRLIRQLLTESLTLAVAGGALGLLVAPLGAKLLVQALPASRILQVQVDWRVLLFGFAVSLLTGVVFGSAPAWQATRPDLAPTLKNETTTVLGGARRIGLRNGFLIAQVGLSVLLVVGAGLLVRTFQKLRAADTGLRSENVLQLSLSTREAGYTSAQSRSFYARLITRIQELPGVRAASLVDTELMGTGNQQMDIYPPGYQPRPHEDVFSPYRIVESGFFDTVGIARLQGRDFTPQDSEKAPKVAIVNEPMARYFFGNQNPIGRRIGEGGRPELEIVGVVRATKYRTMRDAEPRIVYLPFSQMGFQIARTLYVQAGGDPGTLLPSIQRIVSDLDKGVPVYGIKTLAQQIDESMAQEQLTATLSGFFGMLALALAALGLYGVMSYNIARRTREIGVRMALGSQPAEVLRLVLRETLWLTLAGILAGIIGALITTRLIASMLYGVTPNDPITLGISTTVMLATAVIAGYLPARRASRIDPMVALRYE